MSSFRLIIGEFYLVFGRLLVVNVACIAALVAVDLVDKDKATSARNVEDLA